MRLLKGTYYFLTLHLSKAQPNSPPLEGGPDSVAGRSNSSRPGEEPRHHGNSYSQHCCRSLNTSYRPGARMNGFL